MVEDVFNLTSRVNISQTKALITDEAGRHIKENFILNQECLKYLASYKYLSILFSASESFTFADELFRKDLNAFFGLQKYFLSLSYNVQVSTALHVFDHTIKNIILYSCKSWKVF